MCERERRERERERERDRRIEVDARTSSHAGGRSGFWNHDMRCRTDCQAVSEQPAREATRRRVCGDETFIATLYHTVQAADEGVEVVKGRRLLWSTSAATRYEGRWCVRVCVCVCVCVFGAAVG